MINGVPPELHQLASDIWYLSLQDRIDFWEIMQKMNCHVCRRFQNKKVVIPSFCRGTETTLGLEKDTAEREAVQIELNLLLPLKSVAPCFFYGNGLEQ